MVSSKEILPVVLVSCAAIIALAFLVSHFAAQQLTGQFYNPQLDKQYYRASGPSAISVKQTCVLQGQYVDCANPDEYCSSRTGNTAAISSTCSSRAITCELPCGMKGLECFDGQFSTKPC